MLNEAGLLGAKPADTTLPLSSYFTSTEGKPLVDAEKCRWLVRKLLYFNFTCPDVSFVVHHLSQFVHTPTNTHWNKALPVLKHLKGIIHYGLFYSASSSLQLQAFFDVDYSKCNDTRHSVT